MTAITVGIDPGMTGALAILNHDNQLIAICPVCGKEWQVLVRLLRVLKSEAATFRQRRHRAKQKASA